MSTAVLCINEVVMRLNFWLLGVYFAARLGGAQHIPCMPSSAR